VVAVADSDQTSGIVSSPFLVGLDIGYSPPPVRTGNIIGVICLLAGSDKKKKKTEKGVSGRTGGGIQPPARPN